LRDFLHGRCAADDVIVIEGRSGLHFVPGASSDIAWSTRDLRRFFEFIDYLKHRHALVIIDLPPVVGLAETIRLAPAADHIALIIRWGRTERQFVQFALDVLRTTSISMVAVILNDIDLKFQRRRGYRDHTQVYTDKGLYRLEPKYREPETPASLPVAAARQDVRPEANRSEPNWHDRHRERPASTGSDIERLYDRYRD
jgi:Mrp family chromosome partitioning ATPase